jgi:hypothetical protein
MVVDERNQSGKLKQTPRRRWAVRCMLGFGLLLGIPGVGQGPFPQFPSANNGKSSHSYPNSAGPFDTESAPDPKRLRLLNVERQKSIVSDTEKLLKLARELNDEVAGSDSSLMTDAQLRKVAEIGKLARSVKEKMSYSVGPYPAVNKPPNLGEP